MPFATLLELNMVAAFPVLTVARSLRPDCEPAWMMYDVGAHPPAGALHMNVTVVPLTVAASPLGAPGSDVHAPLDPIGTTTSLDAALTPPAFCARTRT